MTSVWSSVTSVLPLGNLRGHRPSASKPMHPEQVDPEILPQPTQSAPQDVPIIDTGDTRLSAIYNESSINEPLVTTNTTFSPLIGDNSTTNNNETSTIDGNVPTENEHMSVSTLLICSAFVVALFWLALPRDNEVRARAVARRRRERRERREREERVKAEQRREEVLIPKCLHIQKVLKKEGEELTLGPATSNVGEEGEGQQGETEHNNDNNPMEAQGSDEFGDESSMCVICLEPFLVGDVLAWSKGLPQSVPPPAASSSALSPSSENPRTLSNESANETVDEENPPLQGEISAPICNHVFHKECIASWLLNPKHDDCPACRTRIVIDLDPIEEDGEIKPSNSEEESQFEEDDGGLSSMAFVVAHGLVRASYSLIGSNVNAASSREEEEEEEEEEEVFEDEHSFSGMEMMAPPTIIYPPSNIAPPPIPLRRVSSHGNKPSPPRMLRRRSSSFSSKSITHPHDSTPAPIAGPPPPRQSPYALRRTLSAGTIIRDTAEGAALLIKDMSGGGGGKSPKPARRPSWTFGAERALSDTLATDHKKSRASPFRARSVVSVEGRVSSSSPGEFRKIFRKNSFGSTSSNHKALPPLPLTTRKLSRKKTGYSLLDTAPSSSSSSSHHDLED